METHESVGDVVIVHNESLPRGFWKLGCIQNLMDGKDGTTRGAIVGIAGKNHRFTSLNRPLQLLYPLEIDHSTGPLDTQTETQEPENKENQRSKTLDNSEDQPINQPRTAARKGEEKRRLLTSEL